MGASRWSCDETVKLTRLGKNGVPEVGGIDAVAADVAVEGGVKEGEEGATEG